MGYPSFTQGETFKAADANAVGLWLISSQTIGSGVATVNVPSVFSASYDNYRIIIANVTGSGGLDFRMQLTGLTTAVYNYGVFYATSGTTGNASASSQTFWTIGSADSGSANSVSLDVYGPFSTSRTSVSGTAYGNNVTLLVGGQAVDTNSRTGFSITTSSGTITGGTIRVYGYKNGLS